MVPHFQGSVYDQVTYLNKNNKYLKEIFRIQGFINIWLLTKIILKTN